MPPAFFLSGIKEISFSSAGFYLFIDNQPDNPCKQIVTYFTSESSMKTSDCTPSLNRRRFLATAATAAGAALATAGSSSARPSPSTGRQRNVLLIISDDHGQADSGCYGHPVLKTPNLDKLAGNGVRFTKAFTTVASCSASRSVIFTGLFNHTNGQFGHQHMPADLDTHDYVRGVASLLAEAGYRTGLVGKYHVGPDEVYGFDELISAEVGYQDVKALAGNRDVWNMARQAGQFFSRGKEQPFFLTVAYSDPHRDWKASNSIDFPHVDEVVYSPDDVVVPPFLPNSPECRAEMAQYYQSVSRLDKGVGFLMDELEKSGLAEDTLVIYISDNGIAMPGAKTTIYDPGVLMPMLLSCPELGLTGGTTCDAMISFTDLVPSILDWAGAEGPGYELPGRSFLPIAGQENPAGWDQVFCSHTFHEIQMYYPMRSIRTRKYKYILNLAHKLDYPFATDLFASETWQAILTRQEPMLGTRTVDAYIHRQREELYDLESDPGEVVNLADSPAQRAVLDNLRARLKAWQEDTKDPWLMKYKYE